MIRIYLNYITITKENAFVCETFESLEEALEFIGGFSTYNEIVNVTLTRV